MVIGHTSLCSATIADHTRVLVEDANTTDGASAVKDQSGVVSVSSHEATKREHVTPQNVEVVNVGVPSPCEVVNAVQRALSVGVAVPVPAQGVADILVSIPYNVPVQVAVPVPVAVPSLVERIQRVPVETPYRVEVAVHGRDAVECDGESAETTPQKALTDLLKTTGLKSLFRVAEGMMNHVRVPQRTKVVLVFGPDKTLLEATREESMQEGGGLAGETPK